jgi:hypothetical protein
MAMSAHEEWFAMLFWAFIGVAFLFGLGIGKWLL